MTFERTQTMIGLIRRLKLGEELTKTDRELLVEWFEALPKIHLKVQRATEAIAMLSMTVDSASAIIADAHTHWKEQADIAIQVGATALVGLGEAVEGEKHGDVWERLVDRYNVRG